LLSQLISVIFDPRHHKAPEPMATKIDGVTMSRISIILQNCITIRLRNFAPAYAKLPTRCSLG